MLIRMISRGSIYGHSPNQTTTSGITQFCVDRNLTFTDQLLNDIVDLERCLLDLYTKLGQRWESGHFEVSNTQHSNFHNESNNQGT